MELPYISAFAYVGASNDIAGVSPPNDRFDEGNVLWPPSNAFGDTDSRSTVYSTAGDAVGALLALGLTPSA
jgi:hypothetical protein